MLNTGVQQNSKAKLQIQIKQYITILRVLPDLWQQKIINMS